MAEFSTDLSGRVALVTGASSGLGLHFASVLSRAGAFVALGARRVAVLKSAVADILARGGRAAPIELDVTCGESVRNALDLVEASFGTVEVLVNSAGITMSKPVLEQTEADWDNVLNTNLRGTFLVATEMARRLRDCGRKGTIINVASILGLRQASLVAPYAISKAGVIQLTQVLALELARFGIRVNAIAPGYFSSDINREFFASEAGTRLIKRIPQRRLGSYEDLDGPLLLLASNASEYMTGSTIVVDGGHLTSTL